MTTHQPAADAVAALGITIESVYRPHKTPAGEQPECRWLVTVRRNGRPVHETDYFSGCAHSPEHKRNGCRVTAVVVAECETGRTASGRPVPPPDVCDVVYCLLCDAEGTDESFEDWCAEHGDDPDSRKAERTYNQCREVAAAFRRSFNPAELDTLRVAFQDY